MDNPYEPPNSPNPSPRLDRGSGPSNSIRIYSAAQIAIATFLGSPLAGTFLLASNYRFFDRKELQRRTFILGAFATLFILGASLSVSEDFPAFVFPVFSAFILGQTTNLLQGPSIRAHLDSGGGLHSWWRVVGISVCVSILLLFFLIPLALYTTAESF